MDRIVFSTTSFGVYDNSPLQLCGDKGFEVVLNPYNRKVKPAELIDLAKDAVGLIAGTEPLTRDVLSQLPNLKVISRCGVGMDNVDVEAATELGIKVFNTPFGPTLAVAELTVGLILNLLRKVSLMDKNLRSTTWKKLMGNLLHGKKVGIVGFGRIGQQTAALLLPFGVELSYCDMDTKTCSFDCSQRKLEDILGWADIITLHISTTAGCGYLIGEKEFQLMKENSWLINVARGGVVDEAALYNALKEGHLAGAAIDVFEHEPYDGPLKELDNTIITPHIGSYAKEGRIQMEIDSVKNLLDCLEGENG